MRIKTKFSNGDTVYCVNKMFPTDSWLVIGPMTIGQVRAVVTDSPGVEGKEAFSNYMEQCNYEEDYMCVETGIGSGRAYRSNRLFSDRASAEAAAKELNRAGQ